MKILKMMTILMSLIMISVKMITVLMSVMMDDDDDDGNVDDGNVDDDDDNLDVGDDEHTWSAPLESRAPRPCCKCGTSSRPPP